MTTLTFTINAEATAAVKSFRAIASAVTRIGKSAGSLDGFASVWGDVARQAQASTGALDALNASMAPLASNIGKASRAAGKLSAHLTALAPSAGAATATLAPMAGAAATTGASADVASAGVATLVGALLSAAVASKSARTAMGPLNSEVKATQEAAQAALSPTQILGKSLAQIDKDVRAGSGLAELSTRLESLKDEVVEFGGGVAEMKAALGAVGAVAEDTGKPIALVSNALRKLVDESEDTAAAVKALPLAMAVAERGMLKTEDAGALMGRALKGDTAVLKELGGVSAKVAAEIDKIPDPAKRAALTLREVRRVVEGTAGPTTKLGRAFGSLKSEIAETNSKLAATGIPGLSVQNILLGIAGAAITAAVAIGTKLRDAVDAYTKSARGNIAAAKELEKQSKKLEITIGKLAHEYLEVERTQRESAARTEALNAVLDTHGAKLLEVVSALGAVGLTTLSVAIPPLGLMNGALLGMFGSANVVTAGLDRLLGTSKALSRQLRTELVTSTRMAMRALAALQEMLPTGLNAAAGEGAAVAAVGGIAKDLGRAAKSARPRRGGGGGGGQKTSEKDDLLALTSPAFGTKYSDLDAMLERAREVRDKRRAATAAQFAALDEDLSRLQDLGRETVNVLNAEAYNAAVTRTGNVINGVLQSATSSTYQLIDALAMGSLTLRDFGAASAVAGGDLIANLGMDIVSQAVGTFAQQLGSVFVGIGAGFEALASNPLALLGIGAGLVAAGVMLKKFGSSSSSSGASRARTADSSAASAVQALGRNLFAEQDREERTINLVIGDYQRFRGMIRDTAGTAGAGAPYQRGLS